MSDTWCVLPWIHMCVRTDNVLKPCCRFLSESDNDNISLDKISKDGTSAMNSDTFVQLRKNMLAGVKTPGCQKCYSQELKNSGTAMSMRQYNNRLWKEIRKEDCDENFSQVRYIEMSIDNICNLQCQMCNSKFSSKLIRRDEMLGNTVYKKLEPSFRKLDSVDLSNLDRVKILGGEPFITPNFSKFIDYLTERADPSRILIDIVTNATTIPSNSLIKKLNKFKFININISLDAYDKANDYQRVGGDFQQTYNNSLKYMEIFTNAEFSYHVTVSTLTANKLSKTLNFFESTNSHYSVDFVRHPEHLSLLYTPEEFSSWVLTQNENNDVAHRLIKTFLKEANYNDEHWNKFKDTNEKLDKYYKRSMSDFNPELYNFLKERKEIK